MAALLQTSDGSMVLVVEEFVAGVRMLHAPRCRQPVDVEVTDVDSMLVTGVAATQCLPWALV